MKIQIDSLLELASTPELPVSPLLPQRQERILAMTKEKIQPQQTVQKRHRPVRIFATIAAIVILLCGTAFAAYEFQLFDFAQLFGENASIIEEAVVTYEPDPTAAVSAQTGRNKTNFTTAEDYNFLLRGKVTVTDNLILASFQISAVSEDIQNFTESGMKIEIDGYDTESYVRWSGDTECINVYSRLDTPLSNDADIRFVIRDDTESTVILENAPMEWYDNNIAVFTDHDPDADYVVDTVGMTNTTITVTGHFQKEYADYSAELDASGGYMVSDKIRWPLFDKGIETFDPEDGNYHEDLEGYLLLREVTDDGAFTIQWTMTKGIPGYGTLVFDNKKYDVPEPEQTEAEIVEPVPTLATSAETQDYRFTLESMVATSNMIYAIMDMEPITEYGSAHMDLEFNELTIACSNITHPESGTTGTILIESGQHMNRYLVYNLASTDAAYQLGDIVHFDILSIMEEGDTAEHNYSLFDTELTSIVSATAEAVQISEDSDCIVHYNTVTLTPMTLYLSGTYDPNAAIGDGTLRINDVAHNDPEIIMTFKDGTSMTLMDENWTPTPELASLGQYGIASSATRGNSDNNAGTVTHTYLFSQIFPLEEIDTITIDDVVYQVNYEIA